jgi:hypothetical protein
MAALSTYFDAGSAHNGACGWGVRLARRIRRRPRPEAHAHSEPGKCFDSRSCSIRLAHSLPARSRPLGPGTSTPRDRSQLDHSSRPSLATSRTFLGWCQPLLVTVT